MVSLDVALRGIAAITSCVFALVAIGAGWRRPSYQYFAAFFLFVAGNHVGEAFSAASVVGSSAQLVWLAFAFVCAALDPILLYLVATARDDGEPSRRRELVVILVGTLAVVALTPFAFASYDAGVINRVQAFLGIFTAVVYVVTLRRFLVRLSQHGAMSAGSSALLAGLFIIVLPAWTRSANQALEIVGWYLGLPESANPTLAAWSFGLHIVFAATFVLLARSALPRNVMEGIGASGFRRAIYLSFGVLFLIDLSLINALLAAWGLMPHHQALGIFGRTGAALRWILVGAFLSAAVLRHRALSLKISTRRHAAQLLVALAFLEAGVLVVIGVEAFRPGTISISEPITLTILIGAVVISQGFRNLVDRFAERVYGVPPADDVVAQHTAYSRAVGLAYAEGSTAEGAKGLARLRSELGIDEAVALAIERGLGEVGGRILAPGRLIGSRYRVVAVLRAEGGRSAALADDALLDRPVILDRFALPTDDDRFLDRARIYGALTSPNLARVEDFIAGAGEAFVVFGDVETESLRSWCAAMRTTDERHRAAHGVAAAVRSLHAVGYVHGRLTMDAFVIRPDGSAVLADPAIDAAPERVQDDLDATDRVIKAIVGHVGPGVTQERPHEQGGVVAHESAGKSEDLPN